MKSIDRRSFFRLGGALGAATIVETTLPVRAKAASPGEKKKILNYNPDMPYRRLGDKDVYLSAIAMGGLVMNDNGESHHYAIDHGCNIVHISNGYLGGKSIKVLGKVMKTKRDKVYIALKDNFFSDADYKAGKLGKIDEMLKILNTDHVDFLMFNRHKVDKAANPYLREAFEKLRDQGKVRFMGLTCHSEVKGVMQAAIDSGFYDLLNPVLNQPSLVAIDAQLNAAKAKNIGVMGMKTMKGLGNKRDLEAAYLKKVLAHPGVTNIVKGIGSREQFDAYLAAAGAALSLNEDDELYRHAQANRTENCMMCDACHHVCPQGIEISTVLRCIDYYLGEQNDTRLARETYRELDPARRWNIACRDCHICEEACPNDIKIVQRLENARFAFA